MKVLLSGAGGFVGSAIREHLRLHGHDVLRMVRRERRQDDEVQWDPVTGRLLPGWPRGCQAVIHLAGENIAGIWTDRKKAAIRSSRVDATGALCQYISRLESPPVAFLCASAVGYYGDRGDDILSEAQPPGGSFLAGVCRDWEAATAVLAARQVRAVNMRLGIVLGRGGGALKMMLRPFRLCMGGKLGDGRQYMSWISLRDVCRAADFCMENAGVSGPVNFTSPQPVTNAEFVRTLGRVLRRPALCRMPAWLARAALGELADEILASVRAVPDKLISSGFRFDHADLEKALREK